MISMSIIQHPYRVKTVDNETILLDKVSEAESCVEYALKHTFSVLLTETKSTSTAEIIAIFLQAGFKMEVREENEIAPGGTPVTPDIYFLFTKNQE